MKKMEIKEVMIRSTIKTGIFKRRMFHVARRFGAIQKWVNLSKVSINKMMESFKDTAIYDEALKEIFRKDLNIKQLHGVLESIRLGIIKVHKLETSGKASPIAKVGIEKASMKTDLIPPERMKYVLISSARARLLSESRTFFCIKCWDYLEMIKLKDLPMNPICPKCGSPYLGVLGIEEKKVRSLVDKKGEKLNKNEQKMKDIAVKTAKLVSRYGKTAAVSLSGRNLQINDVKKILKKEEFLSDRLFELIIDAEKDSLKRRFW
jgi:ATP-dependent Lhr-like helicase